MSQASRLWPRKTEEESKVTAGTAVPQASSPVAMGEQGTELKVTAGTAVSQASRLCSAEDKKSRSRPDHAMDQVSIPLPQLTR